MTSPYPETPTDRDRWIRALRPPRRAVDPFEPYDALVERERSVSGKVLDVLTLFLATRECSWRCVMCDLWKTALAYPTPRGAVPRQIDTGLARLAAVAGARVSRCGIKLYNGGSFFDAGAVPPADYAEIARRLQRFERVIVECHPALIGPRVVQFRDLLASSSDSSGPHLEVAMGLETAHPQVLERLNKRMTLDQFAAAAAFLLREGVAVRAFVLVQPPFLPETEALDWAKQSTDFAFGCGVTVVSLIPVRAQNGAMETLATQGRFFPPRLETLERAVEYGVARKRGRVFADLWDLHRFAACSHCFEARRARLDQVNLTQELTLPVICEHCRSPSELQSVPSNPER